MEKELTVNLIGLGMGRNHLKSFKQHARCRVTGIADVDTAKLKRYGDEHNVEGRYTDWREMLTKEKPDLVCIAVPNFLHKEITLAAFEAGAHVLCEKPMAMNAAEGREMIAASKKAKKRLMINFSYRFYSQSWSLKQQVDAGLVGDIYFGRTFWHRRRDLPGFGGWFGQKKMSGGGPLIDLGVHRLDLALWLMGYPKPAYVAGSTYNAIAEPLAKKSGKPFDVEDLACGFIRFANGASLILEASWAGNIKEAQLMETRLWGTQGGLIQYNLNHEYTFAAEIVREQNGSQYDMRLNDRFRVGEPASSMAHFVDCILDDKPHIATGEEGLIVQEILDAIYESAKIGKPVEIG